MRVLCEIQVCPGCGQEKHLSEFAKHLCKKCHCEKHKAWRRANPERAAEIQRKSRAKHAEKTAATKKAWRIANREAVLRHKRDEYARDHEKIKARVVAWRASHPVEWRAQALKRRALQRDAAGVRYTTAEHIRQRVRLYGGLCYYCGALADSIDHRIPLTRGGSHWPANLMPVCKSCNSRKHNKTEREFKGVIHSHDANRV